VASRIKGITIEIGGDTTGLDKALKSVNSSITYTQSTLKDVNKLLKLDPSITEFLTQKQRLLKDAVASTKEKLEALKQAQVQAKEPLENGTLGQDKYDALQREIVETEQELRRLQEQAATTNTALAKIEEVGGKLENVGNSISGVGKKMMPISTAVGGLGIAAVKTAADSGHFADILAAASSNTNVSMMGETFKYCAPIVGALGFSAEDTAEAIGLMANAGIKSSQAGTALRTIMNNLAGDVKISGQAIGDVTIATTNADGSMRSLSDILADCRVAFGGLTESEKAQAAESLVSKNAMSGFLALMNAAPADIEKLSGAIDNCDGTAEKMAATMQDNLMGQLTILKSQLEELAISFGEMLMPAIRSIVTKVQEFVDKLNGMDGGTREMVLKIGLLVAALGSFLVIPGTTISKVGTAMKGFVQLANGFSKLKVAVQGGTGLFGKLGAAIGGISAPVVAVMAVIGTLVATFLHLWNTNEGFREAITGTWNTIKETVSIFCQGIVDRLNALGFSFKDITEVLSAVWNGFCSLLAPVFEVAFQAIAAVLSMVLNVITGMKRSLSGNTWGGSAWDGKSVYTKKTQEYENGAYVTVTAEFRKYPSVEKSIADHSAYLLGAKNGNKLRYDGLKGCTDYKKAVQIIKDGGYATSPTYVENLCSIIERWKLAQYDAANAGETEVWYRVRKTWADAASQKGAFHSLENAKKCADENAGYSVFDESGKMLAGKQTAFEPYLVKVSVPDLNIRKGPGTDKARTGKYTGKSIFTIVEEADGPGASRWGLLKAYQKNKDGWVSLDFARRV